MLLEPYAVSRPSLNRNGIYTSKTPYLLMETSLYNTKRTQRLANQRFLHSKPMEESVILNVQYTGQSAVVKLKAWNFHFLTKKLHNDFF